MVVAVDYRTPEFGADLVKLVAKMRHLICAVFIACDDFINRVNDNGDIVFLRSASDELRRELIHRNRLAAQVPHIDVMQVFRSPAERCIDIFKTVQAACAVKLEIDIHYLALGTFEAQPFASLGYGAAQLYQRKRLAGL